MIGLGFGIGRGAGRKGSTLPPAAPVNTVLPVISGTAASGQTLSASAGGWTGFPTPTFAYQWKRGGTNIGGATANTYLLVSGDVGATITVEVTATNTEGSASATSAGVGPIASVPVNTVLPSISGTTAAGQTLTASTGTWTGTPTPTYTYQWRRDGVAIGGATASTRLLATADVDAIITVAVTATNGAGAVTAISSGVGPVTEGGGVGPARTLESIIVNGYSAGAYSITVEGDAVDGETVVFAVYTGTDPTTASEVSAGTWAGATVVDANNFAWAASPPNVQAAADIPGADYKMAAIVDNGELSNVVVTPFTFYVDTTDAAITAISFSDSGGEGVSFSFDTDEASKAGTGYRVTAWASGTNPSDSQRRTGTGSVAQATGAAGAAGTFTGTVAAGVGTWQLAIWFEDAWGNETFYTHTPDITVASNPLGADAGRLYHFGSNSTVKSGSNVTEVLDQTGLFVDLDSIGAFGNPQQTGTGPIVFDRTAPGDVIQTPSAQAANRRIGQHIRGGGSNKATLFLVIDAASLTTNAGAFFAESTTNSLNSTIYLGANTSSGNLRVVHGVKSAAGADGTSSASTTTALNAASLGICLIEFEIGQTNWFLRVNGTQEATGTVTTGNFPNPATSFVCLGGVANASAATVLATGNFYRFFATSTSDVTALRAALKALYGIP